MSDTNGNSNGQADIPENEKSYEEFNFSEELSDLGKAFSGMMDRAWNSKERHKIEGEVRDGLRRFADEVEGTAKRMREGKLREDINENVKKVREDIETGKVADDVRKGTVDALRSLRDAIDKMADSFSDVEEEKPAE